MNVESWTILKQIGINRSGTTYFERLVRLNFPPPEVLFLKSILGNKHHTFTLEEMGIWLQSNMIRFGHLRPYLDEVKVTIQVRHPLSWSLGFLKHLKRIGKSKGRKPGDPAAHAALIGEWLNPRYQAWRRIIESNPDRVMVIRFEDLVSNFRKILKRLIKKFSIRDSGRELQDVSGEVLSSGRISKQQYNRRDYYTKKGYLKDLAPGVQKAIVKATDWEAAGFFGYTKGK